MLGFGILLSTGIDAAEQQTKTKDADQDGIYEQVAIFDKQGRLIQLTIDADDNGTADRIQYYQDGELERLEEDANADGIFDTRYFYKNSVKTRLERLNQNGQIQQKIEFDTDGRPLVVQEDSSGDHRLDTAYYYENGQVVRIIRQPAGPNNARITDIYQDKRLSERIFDENQDGRAEERLLFC
jgi:antitoxin component YwqK of YwqJK toxin-antitoxin module